MQIGPLCCHVVHASLAAIGQHVWAEHVNNLVNFSLEHMRTSRRDGEQAGAHLKQYCAELRIAGHLDSYDQKQEHVGQHMSEALMQEPGGEPAVRLCAHEGPPAGPPHYQEVPSQQPCIVAVAPGRCLQCTTSSQVRHLHLMGNGGVRWLPTALVTAAITTVS